jgi:fucose permease
VTAIGAVISKFAAQRLYSTFGFQRTLLTTAILGSAFLAVNALFYPGTPHWLLLVALLCGGLSRSVFFTGVNALAFADIDEEHASQATAINSVTQQLAVAGGVAIAGGALEVTSHFHDGGLLLSDFHIAWCVVALVSVSSVFWYFRMPPDAGSEVSGHRRQPGAVPKPAE